MMPSSAAKADRSDQLEPVEGSEHVVGWAKGTAFAKRRNLGALYTTVATCGLFVVSGAPTPILSRA